MVMLYSSLKGCKVPLKPHAPDRVTMYVCGPTVYDRIHLGNARAIVVFDGILRLLRHLYPTVIYVRNITDVDDKINAEAAKRGISIQALTSQTIMHFHEDIEALAVLPPTHEPKATDHIPQMIGLVQMLLDQGHAYVEQGHVLFSVSSYKNYGQLSKMSLAHMKEGARVEVAPYKKNPLDFVLWKPSQPQETGWNSPWGWGRPGWHIECSAMSSQHFGPNFDVHGGGNDLLFPHHENERAQSCCALGQQESAQIWMHNGMLLVEGRKMSKSLGNFVTLHEVLQQHSGEVVRWALLSTQYRQTLDWTPQLLHQAHVALTHLYQALKEAGKIAPEGPLTEGDGFWEALSDDFNTPEALRILQHHGKALHKDPSNTPLARTLQKEMQALGLGRYSPEAWFQARSELPLSREELEEKIQQRNQARRERDYKRADDIRDTLLKLGIVLEDISPEYTSWRLGESPPA
jgi:cysteinyl-tRNA synthetase